MAKPLLSSAWHPISPQWFFPEAFAIRGNASCLLVLPPHLLHCLPLALRDDARLGALDCGIVVRRRPYFVAAEVEKPFAERLLGFLRLIGFLPRVQSIFTHDPLLATLLRLTFANDRRITLSPPHAILM